MTLGRWAALGILFLALGSGCVDLARPGGARPCSRAGTCPVGFDCGDDNLCHESGTGDGSADRGGDLPDTPAPADARDASYGDGASGDGPDDATDVREAPPTMQPNGTSCAAGSECASGSCVDGVCCDTACMEPCAACNVGALAGTCSPVPAATDPDGDCTDEGAVTCGLDGLCDGAGGCRKYPSGSVCVAASCTGSIRTLASRCDGTGICVPGDVQICTPYVCGATDCLTSCTDTAQCISPRICVAGSCGKKPLGTSCAAPDECDSGFCEQGVCCSATCTALCRSCALAGSLGSCTAVPVGQDPLDQCSDAGAATCGADGSCDGSGACRLYQAGTVCLGPSCSVATSTSPRTCNGAGTCNPPTTAPCTPYLCGPTACRTSCATDAECDPGSYCSGMACLVKEVAGTACTAANECASGFCVDGFCCESACAGLCAACAVTKTGQASGLCRSIRVGTDPDGECDPETADSCGRDGSCNGAGACRLWVVGTTCQAESCTGTTYTPARICNGAGACDPVTASPCVPFTCGATACRTVCAADGECATGYYCAGSTCAAKKANGAACSGASQCTSGSCVDGSCCESACTGACMACAVAKTGQASGLCRGVTAGTDPDGECAPETTASCGRDGMCDGAGTCRLWVAGTICAAESCATTTYTPARTCDGAGVCNTVTPSSCVPYTCGATVCRTSCAGSSDCAGSYYCASSSCVPKKGTGTACASTGECASGSCVDGFCCETACTALCMACSNAKTGQANGLCRPVTTNTDPDAECAPESTTTCGRDGMCDGAGACRFWAAGTVCAPESCAVSTYTPPRTCNGAGVCNMVATSSCAPYACGATACKTSCSTGSDCAATYLCSGSVCGTTKPNGGACTMAVECTSGQCVDGFCCETACTALCMACSNAKTGQSNGLCRAVANNTDPDNECTAMAPSSCQTDGMCNGSGACRLWASGTVCVSQSCAGTTFTPARTCDGSGACGTVSPSSCLPYVCSGTVCRTTCAANPDCDAAYYCSGTTCVAKKATGTACGNSGECATGFCIDGFCCENGCAGTCMACSNARTGQTNGLCRGVSAGTDPDNDCTADPASTCLNDGACNGSGACRLWASGTVCVGQSCAGTTFTPAQTCNGTGTCQTVSTSSCVPYACGASSCNTTCATSADCASTHYCAAPSCVAKKANGTACGSGGECSSTFCVDAVCCENSCIGSCMACSGAKTGQASGLCRGITAGTDPDGDCSAQTTDTCGRDGSCNGSGVCRLWAAGTVCAGETCSVSTHTPARTCDGAGTCGSATPNSCAPYVCSTSTCRTTCGSTADCVAPSTCVGTTCSAELACNDDTVGCAPSDHGSRISLTVTAGTTYYLFVEGGPTAPAGSQIWNPLTFIPPSVALAGGPFGATCATTAGLMDPAGGIYTGTTAGGTSMSTAACATAGPDTIYKIVPYVGGSWSFTVDGPTLGSVSVTIIPDCTMPGSNATCSSGANPRTASKNLTAGVAAYVIVDGSLAAGGAYTLTVTPPAKSVGVGSCASPQVVQPGGGKYSGVTGGFPSVQDGSCGVAGKDENILSWTPTLAGTWTIQTCGGTLDTVLYARSSCP